MRRGAAFRHAHAVHPGQADPGHTGYSKCPSLLLNGPCALRVLRHTKLSWGQPPHMPGPGTGNGVCPEQVACWLYAVPIVLWHRNPDQLQCELLGWPLEGPFPLSALFPGCVSSQLWLTWGSVGVLWVNPAPGLPGIICGTWLRVSATVHIPRSCPCWLSLGSHSLGFW